jgi:hypothetical protein
MKLGMAALRPAFAAALLAASAFLATGCNGVVSSTPLIGPADAAGAPKLRAGLWRVTSDPKKPCAVNERKPFRTWPDCAGALVVKADAVVGYDKDKGRWTPTSFPYALAAESPVVMQVEDVKSTTEQRYQFMWLRVTKTDAQGRITGVEGWRIGCSPPPGPDGAKRPLYPGLTDLKSDCTAGSQQALFDAAKASQRDAGDMSSAHWVRDGTR